MKASKFSVGYRCSSGPSEKQKKQRAAFLASNGKRYEYGRVMDAGD
jgi:hypothetical protein